MLTRPIVAILGPTATGKSALALGLAARFDGEIISCDSTAVYRGFDIGTDRVPPAERRGIPHHLIDVVDPTEEYTAARYAADASVAITDIRRRGRRPIVVGGTGFYYRALTRGLFPGPGCDAALRARLEAIAERRGTPFLHRLLGRVDPASARRIQPRDRKRLVRALEVYFLTGGPLTSHFAQTVSPLGGERVHAFAAARDDDRAATGAGASRQHAPFRAGRARRGLEQPAEVPPARVVREPERRPEPVRLDDPVRLEKASSSGRGCGGSSPKSSATGSFRTLRCR